MKYYSLVSLLLLVAASTHARPRHIGLGGTHSQAAALKVWDKSNPEELGDLFEGDILSPPDLKNGLVNENYRWPNGMVPFVLAEGQFSKKDLATIHRAFDDYTNVTGGCISFVPRTTESDYVYFQSSDEGCSSWVGRRGGKQVINYQVGCLTRYGTVQHEMLHALGFYHEQSRFDRDAYVTISWGNIKPGKEFNFKSYPKDVATGFGVGYDYGSVMHYSSIAFSSDGEPTITPRDPNAVIGQRNFLSKADIRKLKKMYNCI